MNGTILRSEVIKQLDTGEPFDLVFVTADRNRGTGGDLIEVKQWIKKSTPQPVGVVGTPTTVGRKKVQARPGAAIAIFNPISKNIHPITVHFKLMQFFNNQRILNG